MPSFPLPLRRGKKKKRGKSYDIILVVERMTSQARGPFSRDLSLPRPSAGRAHFHCILIAYTLDVWQEETNATCTIPRRQCAIRRRGAMRGHNPSIIISIVNGEGMARQRGGVTTTCLIDGARATDSHKHVGGRPSHIHSFPYVPADDGGHVLLVLAHVYLQSPAPPPRFCPRLSPAVYS